MNKKPSESKVTSNKVLVKSEKLKLGFDEVMEVWYFAMLQGATLWGYSQDTKRNLPDDYMTGLDGLREQIKDFNTLKVLLANQFIVCGLYDEVLSTSSVSTVQPKTSRKKNTSSKKVK